MYYLKKYLNVLAQDRESYWPDFKNTIDSLNYAIIPLILTLVFLGFQIRFNRQKIGSRAS